jgi:hypothetical protein
MICNTHIVDQDRDVTIPDLFSNVLIKLCSAPLREIRWNSQSFYMEPILELFAYFLYFGERSWNNTNIEPLFS